MKQSEYDNIQSALSELIDSERLAKKNPMLKVS